MTQIPKGARNQDGRALRHEDMDVARQAFALRYVSGGSNGLVELYIEDDEAYHLKMSFDRYWLPDLIATVTAGQQLFGLSKR